MADDVLTKIETALTDLNAELDKPQVRNCLDDIPSSLRDPVVSGLRTLLNVYKQTLNDLKTSSDCVDSVDDLLESAERIVDAGEGLAPGEADTFNTVRSVITGVRSAAGAVARIDRIIGLIDQVVTKLETL